MDYTLSAIKRIENKARRIPGVISLAQGIPSFSSSSLIRAEVIEAILGNKIDKYSPVAGLIELRSLISQKLLEEGLSYDPESEIMVTAGAIEALSAAILALINPGDEVIYLSPGYSYYERIIRMAGGMPVPVALKEDKGWSLDLKLLKRKVTKKTKAIIICNPNNPTGSVLSKTQLWQIASLAKKHKFLVISDDIYEHFCYGKKAFKLCSEPGFKQYVLHIVSLSKHFSLSGWRVGFMYGDNQLIQIILPVHDNLVNCAPVASQYAALAALKNQQMILPEYQRQYLKRRQIMGKYLSKLGRYLSFCWPQGAYYFFPKIFGLRDSEAFCLDLLEKSKVAVVPGADFGPGGEGHIRLCFGKSEEEIKEGMERITRFFEGK